MTLVYEPAEDSFLLQLIISKYAKNKTVLDMCSGSGILAKAALSSGAKSVIAVDINPDSIKILKKEKIKAIKSNLFEKIKKSQKFDLIICNPPYLPEDKREDKDSQKATTGGKKGDELILKFLKQSQEHINPRRIILLLISSLTPEERINNLLRNQKMKYKIIAEKKLFFETLQVWEIEHNNN